MMKTYDEEFKGKHGACHIPKTRLNKIKEILGVWRTVSFKNTDAITGQTQPMSIL